jgi:hypothetical protein
VETVPPRMKSRRRRSQRGGDAPPAPAQPHKAAAAAPVAAARQQPQPPLPPEPRQRPIPARRCQCMRDGGDEPCGAAPVAGTLFCARHAGCRPSPLSGAEPPYDPRPFDDPAVRSTHNCYSYAVLGGRVDGRLVAACKAEAAARGAPGDCPSVRFHQPGAASGAKGESARADRRHCAGVVPLVLRDVPGAYRTTFAATCAPGTSKVALATDPGRDYHFYVEGADGWWSDKPGARQPKRLDGSYQPTFNPAAMVRDYSAGGDNLNYTQFCGFFCVPRGANAPRLEQGGGGQRRRRAAGSRRCSRSNGGRTR